MFLAIVDRRYLWIGQYLIKELQTRRLANDYCTAYLDGINKSFSDYIGSIHQPKITITDATDKLFCLTANRTNYQGRRINKRTDLMNAN